MTAIFIFRRDLRIFDNHALNELAKRHKQILPVFFLDRHQIVRGRHNAAYFSNNAVQFMCESLRDLDAELRRLGTKLHMFLGDPKELLLDLLKATGARAVGWNADFSEYSQKRDASMRGVCEAVGAEVIEVDTDYTLRPMQENLTKDGNGYKQFGAFYKLASKQDPSRPSGLSRVQWEAARGLRGEVDATELLRFYKENAQIAQRGGRAAALARLRGIGEFRDYNNKRDLLAYNTTNISAALNFGCISVREAYWAMREKLGSGSQLLKQLYWRDFFLQVARYIPRATSYKRMMDERYDALPWKNDKKDWERLMAGKTGFLLIDAGMAEMKTTGFLHNRLRMILGMFWTKYLQIHILHPKYGSQVGFSSMLVDAVGPSQNKMNHHWILDLDYPGKKFSARGAPLSGRPMDVSNKMIKKWDPDGAYVKKWLPHLRDVPMRDLASWDADIARQYGNIHAAPMFDAHEQYKNWIEMCRS
jgi:deoxyribodipyrimidine photo-lyase